MPEIAKLGHVALKTPKIEESLWFFRDVVGLEEVDRQGNTVFLKAWGDFEHHTLSLIPDDHAAVDHIAWRAKRREDVALFAEQLEDSGTKIRWIEAGVENGQGDAIRFSSPNGYPLEVYYDVEKPRAPEDKRSVIKTNAYRAWDHGISPRRIDHVNVTTDDPPEATKWLEELLGFKKREYIRLSDGHVLATWLGVSALAHDLAVGPDATGRTNGLHHVGFYVDNWHDVLRAADVFAEHGVESDHGPGRHAISQAVYLYTRDPGSGHRLELYSGSYLILDPDWEAVEWTEDDYRQWWGSEIERGKGSPMDETTLC